MNIGKRPLRLVVTGVESTGKTTLAQAVSEHFGFPLALEAARYDPRVRQGNLNSSDLDRLTTLQFNAALEAEQQALKSQAAGLISDTGGIVMEMWGSAAFDTIPQRARNLQSWFDFYILCTPDIPWESDPLRSMPLEDDRWALHDRYVQRLNEAGYPWVKTKGSAPLERFLFVVQAIEGALEGFLNE